MLRSRFRSQMLGGEASLLCMFEIRSVHVSAVGPLRRARAVCGFRVVGHRSPLLALQTC